MKMNLKSVLALLLAAVMLLGLCACGDSGNGTEDTAEASPSPEVSAVPDSVESTNANVYSVRMDNTAYYAEPKATTENTLGLLKENTQLEYIETSGEFYKVSLPINLDAWVHSWFVKSSDAATEAARVKTLIENRMNKESFVPIPGLPIYTCMAGELNCRSDPHTGGIVYCQIEFGDEVTVLGKDGSYYLCLLEDGSPVYCSAEYLVERASYVDLEGAVDLRVYMSGAEFDLSFASEDNVTGEALYEDIPLVDEAFAEKLMEAYEIFRKAGYTIKIYDVYRPASAQTAIETAIGGATDCGSQHSSGYAIDMSLVNIWTSKELRMPTAVHEFGEKTARTASDKWDWEVNNNVKYMTDVMTSVGFETVDGAWWHFQLPGTGSIDSELDYDSLTFLPVSHYDEVMAEREAAKAAEAENTGAENSADQTTGDAADTQEGAA